MQVLHTLVPFKTRTIRNDHYSDTKSVRSDDRWINLRSATHGQNRVNAKTNVDNVLGHKGIRLSDNGRFSVRIGVNKRRIWVGTFDTLEDAIENQKIATERVHGEFASHRSRP